MSKSVLIAALLVAALVLWMLSGQLGSKEDSESVAETNTEESAVPLMKVRTRSLQAENITREVVVQGQLEPVKVMTLRAETDGNIQQLDLDKGQKISRGQSLALLSIDTRNANLAVAEANLVQAESEYQATRKLQRQGLQSKLSLESAGARQEAARAQVEAAKIEIANTTILSPINALIEDVHVKVGDFVDRGAQIATLVDNSQVLVTGQVSQQYITDISVGQPASAELVTGQTVEGTVSFISSMADKTTRSFEIEVLIPDPPENISTGLSAQINIPVEELMAHRVSPAMMAISDDGVLGVKTLDENNKVAFNEIKVVKTETRGAWVTGLPNDITLITLGQAFVSIGEEVEAVPENTKGEVQENSTTTVPAG